MALLNYTTQIAAEKTVAEITSLLAKAKCSAILTEYQADGRIKALSFRIQTQAGVMSFLLPANVEAVYKTICRDKALPYSRRTPAQAERIAWRIIKDWVAAQLALISVGLADLEQVFLPYAQRPDGTTLYEELKNTRFEYLALPPD
jgi:hypothetical protein